MWNAAYDGPERRWKRPRGVINPLQDHVYDKAEAERGIDPLREQAIDRYVEFSGETRDRAAEEIDTTCNRAAMRYGYTKHQTYALILDSIELEIRRDDAEVFALLRRNER